MRRVAHACPHALAWPFGRDAFGHPQSWQPLLQRGEQQVQVIGGRGGDLEFHRALALDLAEASLDPLEMAGNRLDGGPVLHDRQLLLV